MLLILKQNVQKVVMTWFHSPEGGVGVLYLPLLLCLRVNYYKQPK